MGQHCYTVAGLRVVSELEMPGLLPGTDRGPTLGADVMIARAPLPPAPAQFDDPYAELRFDVAGLMRMAMHRGDTLLYDPEPDAPPADMALYLGGTGFGALLHQRGLVVLHASAVRVGDRAMLFCGASGAGKSTLAAALVDAGHDHVADDFCAIRFAADGTPMVAPDGRRHKLWDSAIAGLAWPDRRGGAVRSDMAKFYVDPRRTVAEALPIGAVFELALGDDVQATPLTALETVALIRVNAYRPQLVDLMGQARLYFEAATHMAPRCRFVRLTRPLAYDRMPELVQLIEQYAIQPNAVPTAAA